MVYEPEYISNALVFLLILYPFLFVYKVWAEDNNGFEKVCRVISVIFYVLTIEYITGHGLLQDENDMLFGTVGVLDMGILVWAYIFMSINLKIKK